MAVLLGALIVVVALFVVVILSLAFLPSKALENLESSVLKKEPPAADSHGSVDSTDTEAT